MWALVGNELIKAFSKYRLYIGFAALLVLFPLILWGFRYGGSQIHEDIAGQLKDTFIIAGSLFNGFLATHISMNFLWVHIPFLVTLMAGDVVAGEGAAGTFRIYLTRPVSRSRILAAKWIATALYTLALVLFFMLMSLGLGSLWLGVGDLVVFDKGILLLPPDTAWLRFLLGFALAYGNLLVVAGLCFMLSSLVNNAIGPMIGAMAILLIGLAIANIPLVIFEYIRPWLFTSYFDIWQKAFHEPLPWREIGQGLLVLGIYLGSFLGISWLVFTRKDILT